MVVNDPTWYGKSSPNTLSFLSKELMHNIETGVRLGGCKVTGLRVSFSGLNQNIRLYPWWRHQMETFSALLAICAGNSPVPGEFPTQRPVTRSFDVYFDLPPNKRLSKQWRGWQFETLSPPLWRHRNVNGVPVMAHKVTFPLFTMSDRLDGYSVLVISGERNKRLYHTFD